MYSADQRSIFLVLTTTKVSLVDLGLGNLLKLPSGLSRLTQVLVSSFNLLRTLNELGLGELQLFAINLDAVLALFRLGGLLSINLSALLRRLRFTISSLLGGYAVNGVGLGGAVIIDVGKLIGTTSVSLISNDTSTATNVYPLFASATSGTATTLFTGNTSITFTASTSTNPI